jgi:hypothetical protein
MSRSAFIAAALAFAVTLPAVSAQAQAPRTFVSAAGSDSNPCSFAAPCRHFQAAVNATSAGGEVDALDPAGYGPITINQAITIEGQGWSYIAPPAGGNGITVNAVSGNVSVHGVSINGVGITGGTNGIVFNSGGGLIVRDSVMQNFSNAVAGNDATGNGILIQPISGAVTFVITNTVLSHNAGPGFSYLPQSGTATGNGIIDHVVSNNNQEGLLIDTGFASGQVAVAISNTIVSNNTSEGIQLIGTSALAVSIDNTNVGGSVVGIDSGSTTPTVTLGRSVITANGIGVASAGSRFFSFQDNRISGNGTDVTGPLNSFALR